MSKDKRMLDDARSLYLKEPGIRSFAASAARTEATGYAKDVRVEEIMAYGRWIGAKHVGIACCVGTQREERLTQEIFEANGFRVPSIAFKVGSIPKEELGLTDEEKVRPGRFEALCNPITQARLLAEAGTSPSVLIGLCVGHDSLFFRYSEAPVTVLMVRDGVTGHNPAAAPYTSQSYYRSLRNPRDATAAS